MKRVVLVWAALAAMAHGAVAVELVGGLALGHYVAHGGPVITWDHFHDQVGPPYYQEFFELGQLAGYRLSRTSVIGKPTASGVMATTGKTMKFTGPFGFIIEPNSGCVDNSVVWTAEAQHIGWIEVKKGGHYQSTNGYYEQVDLFIHDLHKLVDCVIGPSSTVFIQPDANKSVYWLDGLVCDGGGTISNVSAEMIIIMLNGAPEPPLHASSGPIYFVP